MQSRGLRATTPTAFFAGRFEATPSCLARIGLHRREVTAARGSVRCQGKFRRDDRYAGVRGRDDRSQPEKFRQGAVRGVPRRRLVSPHALAANRNPALWHSDCSGTAAGSSGSLPDRTVRPRPMPRLARGFCTRGPLGLACQATSFWARLPTALESLLTALESSPLAQADAATPVGLTDTVVRGAGVTGAGSLLTQVLSLATYVVLARLAGPEVFGAFAAAWIIVGVASLFVESGMSAALIQRKTRLEEAAATATVSTCVAGVGLTALALLLSPVVGLFFHSSEIGQVSAVLSGILLVNAATVVPDALMRRRFSFLRRGVIDPITALIYGVVGAIALVAGMGVWGLVLAAYISGITRLAATWILNHWLPDLSKVSFGMWRELARFARHMVASESLRVLSDVASTALVGRFLGIAPLGAYRFGWRMATQAAFPIASASTYVLLPAFARISDDGTACEQPFYVPCVCLRHLCFRLVS